jgi:hypothetical protein
VYGDKALKRNPYKQNNQEDVKGDRQQIRGGFNTKKRVRNPALVALVAAKVESDRSVTVRKLAQGSEPV